MRSLRLLLCSALVLLSSVASASVRFEHQRQDYLAAIQALKNGQIAAYQARLKKLDDYPLRGYAEYEFLKDRVGATSPTELRRFIADNKEAPIGEALRKRWLHQLADRGDWAAFVREYEDAEDDHELRCYRLARSWADAPSAPAVRAQLQQLWLTGNKLPAVCEELFAPWRKAEHLTRELVWARIKLAMDRRNLSLSEHLARYLPEADRIWVRRWIAIHKDPARELQRLNYPVESEIARTVVRYGLVRLAYNDAEVAMREWERLKAKHPFTEADNYYVVRMVGIIGAQAHLPIAAEWLAGIVPEEQDETLRHWRVRAAIRAEQWALANSFLRTLNEKEQRDGEWRYWQARAWDMLGFKTKAREVFNAVARERSYYGFLAADRVQQPYAMLHAGLAVTPEEVSAMLARPGIQMAQELFDLGEVVAARRQWAFTTRRMGNRELQVAAAIAAQWGWHDRAIFTLSKTDNLDDLELRFPLLYRPMVEASARANAIDPGWVYGVMRQESAFVSDARSPAGALGLMQLMPATGRWVGRALKLPIKSNDAILNIENNLRLGARYLKTVLDQNDGHHVLATAAYNAGPNRSRTWLPANSMDADIWVDTIPYTETRNYVKNVLAFTTVYEHRLGQHTRRLGTRMPTVEPRG